MSETFTHVENLKTNDPTFEPIGSANSNREEFFRIFDEAKHMRHGGSGPVSDHDAGVAAASGKADLTLKLPGGDNISISGSKETLNDRDGSSLTVDHGKWSLKDPGGNDVKEIPQLTRELRVPQWYDLTNGGKVTYGNDATTITYPDGHTVSFNKAGITQIDRDNEKERIR